MMKRLSTLALPFLLMMPSIVTAEDEDAAAAAASVPPVMNLMEDEEKMARWAVYTICILAIGTLIPILSKVKRSRGKVWYYHLIFLASAVASVFLVPASIQNALFSETGVLIVGTLIPVYESIVAVCTIGVSDDLEWIQFWIVNATFTYATEFMDSFKENYPLVAEHWYEFEFFATLWFLLPFTDGSTLFYDVITAPYITPICVRMNKAMEGYIEIILGIVNTGYMWMIWTVFLTLPEEARRFVVVAVGTVYPIVASTVTITTEESDDETFWLTYWACFSLLFIMMDCLEEFVGSIRGFYSICLVLTVYLFLPMFQGANVVFRKVLVPLSGQYENMLLRDAYLVKREIEKKIPQAMHERVLSKTADMFRSTTTTTKKME